MYLKEGFDTVKLNITNEIHSDNPNHLPPAGCSISIHTIKYHLDRPQLNNINIVERHRRCESSNPYAPFLDQDEFDFAFQLVKHGMAKMFIDNIMALCAIRSNLPLMNLKKTKIFLFYSHIYISIPNWHVDGFRNRLESREDWYCTHPNHVTSGVKPLCIKGPTYLGPT